MAPISLGQSTKYSRFVLPPRRKLQQRPFQKPEDFADRRNDEGSIVRDEKRLARKTKKARIGNAEDKIGRVGGCAEVFSRVNGPPRFRGCSGNKESRSSTRLGCWQLRVRSRNIEDVDNKERHCGQSLSRFGQWSLFRRLITPGLYPGSRITSSISRFAKYLHRGETPSRGFGRLEIE